MATGATPDEENGDAQPLMILYPIMEVLDISRISPAGDSLGPTRSDIQLTPRAGGDRPS